MSFDKSSGRKYGKSGGRFKRGRSDGKSGGFKKPFKKSGGFKSGGKSGGFKSGGKPGFKSGGFKSGGRSGGFKQDSGPPRPAGKVAPHKFQGVFTSRRGKRTLFMTQNLTPGKTVYGEDTVKSGGVEYRDWNIERSKLGAALAKQVSQLGIYPGMKVLYLGASTGTTPSHVSDIVGEEGRVFALDFAPRTTRELVYLCELRSNMIPILGDARQPHQYAGQVCLVDSVFQDVAQRDQAEIFIKNCDAFLKKGGFGVLVIKARSVDVSKKPKEVFKQVRDYLEPRITIVDYRELDPLEKDHCIFICKKK